jgi:Spy/CpxP family protein refolding chaperone
MIVRGKVDEEFMRVQLLASESVQKDLGLTADQIETIKHWVKTNQGRLQEFLAKVREILPPSQHFSPDEATARQREVRALEEDFRNKTKELRTKILAMLTPSQSERLEQIRLQTAVAAALARPEIIKALGITPEESKRISDLRDRIDQKQTSKWLAFAGRAPQIRREKMIEFAKEWDKAEAEANKQILELLTPEQRAKFEKLRGKQIEVTSPYDSLRPEDVGF